MFASCLPVVTSPQPVVGINASRIRLICRGKALSDSVSPASAGTTQETLVHIVKDKVRRGAFCGRPSFPVCFSSPLCLSSLCHDYDALTARLSPVPSPSLSPFIPSLCVPVFLSPVYLCPCVPSPFSRLPSLFFPLKHHKRVGGYEFDR